MLDKTKALQLLADINEVRTSMKALRNADMNGDHIRQLALAHTALDEARLWLDDAINGEPA